MSCGAVAVALAAIAGWLAVSGGLGATWVTSDTLRHGAAPGPISWRPVHPDLPPDPLSEYPDVDVLLSWHGAVVVRGGGGGCYSHGHSGCGGLHVLGGGSGLEFSAARGVA